MAISRVKNNPNDNQHLPTTARAEKENAPLFRRRFLQLQQADFAVLSPPPPRNGTAHSLSSCANTGHGRISRTRVDSP